jgi:hypothetical protein
MSPSVVRPARAHAAHELWVLVGATCSLGECVLGRFILGLRGVMTTRDAFIRDQLIAYGSFYTTLHQNSGERKSAFVSHISFLAFCRYFSQPKS